jgi:superfamily II DNA or RNA helicase
MSIICDINKLSLNERTNVVKNLQFNKKVNPRFKNQSISNTIYPYNIEGDNIFLPFNWCQQQVDCCIRPPRSNYTCDFFPNFKGKLRPLQKKVKKEVIGYLNKNGCCWLSLYTGGGKTFTSINIACSIKLKTIIITHRVNLMNQWISSIENGCSEGVIAQILTGVNKMNEHAQFYVMNAINVKKRNISDYKDIGFLIVDEVHVMATKVMVEAFQYLTPRYCLALSATPYRSDGLDEVLYTYFSKNKIIIKLNKPHTVFKIITKFEPDVKLNYDGSTDWSSVIQSMCNNKERNNLIINIVQLFKDRNFLILSKRIDQIDYLTQQLREKGESVTSFKGSKQKYNCESRILIATISKAGVGFDHPKMDALILASDVEEYFIQYLGRVFRREDVHPLIFDIVDNFNSLKRHYYTRKKVYEESGGTILKFNKENITNFTNNSDDYNKFF